MPREQTQHKYHPILSPPYDSYSSELTPHNEPVIVEGSNILVSRRGWIERRPGTAIYESAATNGNTWQRLYTYRKWNGDTYLMANQVTSTQSLVYSLKVGTDTTFQLISTTQNVTGPILLPNIVDRDKTAATWSLPGTATEQNAASTIRYSDNIKATTTLTAAQSSSSLKVHGFFSASKFGIPSNATLVGITVKIEQIAGTGSEVEDLTFKLFNRRNPAGFGDNKARAAGTFWATADTVITYGGAADLWGLTAAQQAQVNDDLGIIIACKDKAGGAGSTASIDQVTMQLTVQVTETATPRPFDFTTANDTCYYSNGIISRKYDGSNERQWGITPPATVPTTTSAGTGITAVVGWQYVYAWGSESGHISSISPPSASTGAITDDTITVTGTYSTVADITTVYVYRTTDGGGGTYFLVGTVPNDTTGGNWTFDDIIPDTSLSTAYGDQSAPLTYNDPPENFVGLKHWANRIWGFKDNVLYFSGWEEINTGVEEESFPSDVYTGNKWYAPSSITNLATLPNALLIFTQSKIFKVEGDSRTNFSFQVLFDDMGCPILQNKGVAEDSNRVFWFNTDRRIWVTDGFKKSLVSEAVSDEMSEIAFDDFHMVVHRYGEHNWLVVADNADDQKGIVALGPNSPSTAAEVDTGGVAWSNVSNVLVSDNAYATVSLNGSTTPSSNDIRVSNFGFAVPTTERVLGVLAETEAKRDTFLTSVSGSLKLVDSVSTVSTISITLANPGTTDTYKTAGGNDNLFGIAWAPAGINSTNFGFRFKYTATVGISGVMSVDHCRVTVYHTGAKWFILDLSSGKWLPPWTINAIFLHSAELTAGQKTLLYCSRDGSSANSQVRKLLIPPETAVYTDSGDTYGSDYVFFLEELSPSGFTVGLESLDYEVDGSKTTSLNAGQGISSSTDESPVVFFNADEESSAVTWSSSNTIVDNGNNFGTQRVVTAPTLWDSGTNIRSFMGWAKKKCRRALIRFYWFGANQNFRHFSLDYAYRILGGKD